MVGFIFYALQLPEKRWPGRFDIIGHSHQIWHIFVFTGAYLFYVAVLPSSILFLNPPPPSSRRARWLITGSAWLKGKCMFGQQLWIMAPASVRVDYRAQGG